MNVRGIIIVLSLLMSTIQGYSKDYYVSKGGSDQNDGSQSNPFLSIAKASSVMQAGDVCYIREGIYHETLSVSQSGTQASPIVFKAFEEEHVVISAAEVLDSKAKYSGSIFKAAVNMSLDVERRVLFYDGNVLEPARWPNNADLDKFTFDGQECTGGSGSYIESSAISNADWTGGYVCYLGAHSGLTWTREITSSSAGRVDFEAVDINKWPFNPHNPTVLRNGNRGRFYLFGTMAALDAPGEWHYDASEQEVYFIAPDDSDPLQTELEYAARMNAIEVTGDYVQIEGLSAFGGVVMLKGDYIEVRDCNMNNCLQSLDELDNTDAQIGIGAVTVEGSNITLENNLIEHGSGNGIANLSAWKGSQNMTVRNNIVRHFNTIGVHANPVRSNCEGTIIEGNTIYSCGRDGIYTSGANASVTYNDVYECMKINNDGGVFYTVGNDGYKNSEIHHNWFHDSYGPEYADGRAAGIYLDNHSKGYEVHHNVVWNITWSALQINWDNWGIDFFNNSFWEVGEAMGRWANGYTIKDVRVYNNYANVADWIGTDIQSNIINTVYPFTSKDDNNFMPAANSYLIDAGMVIAGITDGYMGDAPDVGAYEYEGEQWMAGADWWPEGEDQEPDVGIWDRKALNKELKVYPNPSNGSFYVKADLDWQGTYYLEVYGLNGMVLISKEVSAMDLGNGLLIEANDLQSGSYLIRVAKDSEVYLGKLLLMK